MENSRKDMSNFPQIKYGILIFGTTGTGKSTLIKGFTGEIP